MGFRFRFRGFLGFRVFGIRVFGFQGFKVLGFEGLGLRVCGGGFSCTPSALKPRGPI